MWICTQAFHVPKRGNAAEEYEDAFYPDRVSQRGLTTFRCAVADGASESAYAGEWAKILVRSFGRRRLRLEQVQRIWQRLVQGRPVPWYLERKLINGAHAALAGLLLRDRGKRNPRRGSWRAVAVGDSCIFHVRGDELLAVGPVCRSDDFDNNPYLVSSKNSGPLRRDDPNLSIVSGSWRLKDIFYLATDAPAQWILAEYEAGRPPWKFLRALGGKQKSFQAVVDNLRNSKALRNDDTTVIRVEVK